MSSINYLHFSDLHLGSNEQKGLISQTKKVLFEDIEYVLQKIKTVEVVFFTGDLVNKGVENEFHLVEQFLNELWALFKKFDLNPYLLCVPGNHDLERLQDINNPVLKLLTSWSTSQINNDYFWDKSNEYYNFIVKRFNNYTQWYNETSIKKPNIIEGNLPGDFACRININGLNMGVVGLNSTFLQLNSGEYKNKLGVYNKQIYGLFGDKYMEWLKGNDISILLTHHSPEWFEENSLDEYYKEIYCSNTYLEHLCGHMHEPSYLNVTKNGFQARRVFITPSLFGLEFYGDNQKTKRIHGYNAGRYEIKADKIVKSIWPRISILTSSGLKITQNEEFNLNKETANFVETIDIGVEKKIENDEEYEGNNSDIRDYNLFSNKKLLDNGLARTYYKEFTPHLNIRLQERLNASKSLKERRFCWIVATYGLGIEEFIGSILKESNINIENCFSINCDEVNTLEDLLSQFKVNFSQDITRFVEILQSLIEPLIVFKNINENLIKEPLILKNFVQTINDYSSNLKTIFITEIPPFDNPNEYTELAPLDVPAVQIYIEKSLELPTKFTFLEYEKIHRLSSGLPIYLDKVLEQLKFIPISDLSDIGWENDLTNVHRTNLSRALFNEINVLARNENKIEIRRFKLLAILSLLHNGETFERIRKFDTNLPFYPDDVTYLLKAKLVESVQINSIFSSSKFDSEITKIIRVPRVIRDYVSSLLSDDERIQIYKNSCDLYLGSNWRNKIKLISSSSEELDYIVNQNLQIALRNILLFSLDTNNEIEAERITRISLELIFDLYKRGSYKDTASLTEDTLSLIKDVKYQNFENIRTHLMRKLGESLRMASINEKSIPILKAICDDETNSLSKKDRNDIRLSLAYAFQSKDNKEEALKYANLIKNHESDKNSSLYLSAETVITNYIEDEEDKLRRLIALKNKAEKYKYNTLRANIVFDLCKVMNDEMNLKLLESIILESKGDSYNKVRALVFKAEIILSKKSTEQITDDDLWGLNVSYSYAFYQRLQVLMTKCHKLAWNYWLSKNRFDELLNLFRYSSFVWRLCGEADQELKYINLLHENEVFINWFNSNKRGVANSYFEQRTFALFKR